MLKVRRKSRTFGVHYIDLRSNLSKSDFEKIRKVSIDLLIKIKERISGMDHWTGKQEIRAAVEVLIRDVQFEERSDSMFDWLEAYRKAVFKHIYTHHKGIAYLEL